MCSLVESAAEVVVVADGIRTFSNLVANIGYATVSCCPILAQTNKGHSPHSLVEKSLMMWQFPFNFGLLQNVTITFRPFTSTSGAGAATARPARAATRRTMDFMIAVVVRARR